MTKRIVIPTVIALSVLGLLYVGLQMEDRGLPSPLVGKPAPPFELESLRDPDKIITEEDFLGEVAIVNVWASWCDVCRTEHEHWRRLSERGTPIHAINYRDTRANAQRYLDQFGDPFEKIAFDPEARAGMDWGVYATPETYILDADGTIEYKHIGPVNDEIVREEILPLIEELEAEQS
ncbi:DsbE family thiol:disulfide interchange protein [Halorhodospira halochloris]|uniref:DsbE family thiol:disulfide interchange protein n=1 Tax=Halorhodospira halochloris TaxID=1052 RepID=UPI001EE79A45|nr:DsbE family thiol:disulfide interchange protein [Halorhodospira halochloris]MCG5530318.1 DsbE family thiol:disulfide interchange protein [Halorhodospira halochloris]MCG5547910.1 DsbE family thiol:disulfide interchange protein [Halorhodospira halochloris]